VIRVGAQSERFAMSTARIPPRSRKHDLAAYLEVDRGRSLRQIASVVGALGWRPDGHTERWPVLTTWQALSTDLTGAPP